MAGLSDFIMCCISLDPGERFPTNTRKDPTDLDEPVQAANLVPEATPSPGLMKKLDADSPAAEQPQVNIKEWQELLLVTLKKDGGLDWLKDWPQAWLLKHSGCCWNSTTSSQYGLRLLSMGIYEFFCICCMVCAIHQPPCSGSWRTALASSTCPMLHLLRQCHCVLL